MACQPRSKPAFPGDIQHDFRDFVLDRRLDTLADWQGKAADCYLRAFQMPRVMRGTTFLTGTGDRSLLARSCAGLMFCFRRCLRDRIDLGVN